MCRAMIVAALVLLPLATAARGQQFSTSYSIGGFPGMYGGFPAGMPGYGMPGGYGMYSAAVPGYGAYGPWYGGGLGAGYGGFGGYGGYSPWNYAQQLYQLQALQSQ